MKKLILLIVMALLFPMEATAGKRKPTPVYIDKPPINRPRTISIPNRNRIYAERNPIPKKMSPEMKEYLKTLEAEKQTTRTP